MLIPAHNEELSIAHTIHSAMQSGQPARDIFVVDDDSNDATPWIAGLILGRENVLTVPRSGKAKAIQLAAEHYDLPYLYQWIHIADADGVFDYQYFRTLRKQLDPNFAAIIGYVKSLPGGWISKYRTMEYTFGQSVIRRIQSILGIIPVLPGPTTCIRSDVFMQLDINGRLLTEDFDMTLQIHANKLGRIKFIPSIIVYTQDPKNIFDYTRQISRWYRGFFQSMRLHKTGNRVAKIDLYLSYQSLISVLSFMGLWAFVLIIFKLPAFAAFLFLLDLCLFLLQALIVAVISRKIEFLAAFPTFYLIRAVGLMVFFKAFIEVAILGKYSGNAGVWSTAGRRYGLFNEGFSNN